MKKFLSLMGIIAALCSCSAEEASLKGNSYQLQDAENNAVVVLAFAEEEPRYYGVVVNRYFGTYETDGNKIKFGPAGSTMMMGPQGEMEVEQKFLQTLPEVAEYKLEGENLTLTTQDGRKLNFFKIVHTE